MSRVGKGSRPTKGYSQQPFVNVEFGFILSIVEDQDDTYYIAIVAKEMNSLQADSQLAIMPIGHTIEELSSLFGEPSDLIGRRVRIEYRGGNWRTGMCRLAAPVVQGSVGTAMEVPSRGFRYAVAGGGSV